MPGPLSVIVIRKRLAWLAGGGGPPLATASSLTVTSGRIPASSQASSALSTASLTQVRSALRGLSKPRRWRFLVKNSETEISRWRAPISTADTPGFGVGAGLGGATGAAAAGSGRLDLRLRLANGSLDGSHIPNIQTKCTGGTQVFPPRRAVGRPGHAESPVISARAAPLR